MHFQRHSVGNLIINNNFNPKIYFKLNVDVVLVLLPLLLLHVYNSCSHRTDTSFSVGCTFPLFIFVVVFYPFGLTVSFCGLYLFILEYVSFKIPSHILSNFSRNCITFPENPFPFPIFFDFSFAHTYFAPHLLFCFHFGKNTKKSKRSEKSKRTHTHTYNHTHTHCDTTHFYYTSEEKKTKLIVVCMRDRFVLTKNVV